MVERRGPMARKLHLFKIENEKLMNKSQQYLTKGKIAIVLRRFARQTCTEYICIFTGFPISTLARAKVILSMLVPRSFLKGPHDSHFLLQM